MKTKKKLHIIYEDKNLLIIDKPPKILTISTEKEKNHTLYHQASEYVKQQHPKNKIFIVHRLDYDTSGIILFAKNEKTQKRLQEMWNQCIAREYLAIVDGRVKEKKKTIINYLKETKTLMVYDTKNPKIGKTAITTYEILQKKKNSTLLKINIQTGRKNQIRVALASIGHPIVGDKKYNNSKNSYGRLELHASKIIITDSKNQKEYVFSTKIPNEWKHQFPIGIEKYEKQSHCVEVRKCKDYKRE